MPNRSEVHPPAGMLGCVLLAIAILICIVAVIGISTGNGVVFLLNSLIWLGLLASISMVIFMPFMIIVAADCWRIRTVFRRSGNDWVSFRDCNRVRGLLTHQLPPLPPVDEILVVPGFSRDGESLVRLTEILRNFSR